MKLLIVDDDKNIVETIQRFLCWESHVRLSDISAVHSLAEAWPLLESRVFSLTLLDLVLPPLSAEETISNIPRMKELCPKIIVISGYEQYREAALDAGATGYLNKLGDLDGPKSFFERIACYLRELKGPTPTDCHVAQLEKIISPQE